MELLGLLPEHRPAQLVEPMFEAPVLLGQRGDLLTQVLDNPLGASLFETAVTLAERGDLGAKRLNRRLLTREQRLQGWRKRCGTDRAEVRIHEEILSWNQRLSMRQSESVHLSLRSCRRERTAHPRLPHPAPIETLEQRLKLRARKAHHPIAYRGPGETALFEALRRQHQTRPVPSHHSTLTRSARLGRNTTTTPENGSSPSSCSTNATRASCPLRKSTGRVASTIRGADPGTIIEGLATPMQSPRSAKRRYPRQGGPSRHAPRSIPNRPNPAAAPPPRSRRTPATASMSQGPARPRPCARQASAPPALPARPPSPAKPAM